MQWPRRSLESLFKPSLGLGPTTASSNDAAGGSARPAALAGLPVPLCLPVLQGATCFYLRLHLSHHRSHLSSIRIRILPIMPVTIGSSPPAAWPDLYPQPGTLRAMLDLTQAQMATALGVTVNTWARWERGELAIHPGYQLLLDYA